MQDKDALQCYIGNVIRVCTVIYFFIIIFFTNILLNSYKCEADNRCSNLRQSLSARSTKIPIYTRGGRPKNFEKVWGRWMLVTDMSG